MFRQSQQQGITPRAVAEFLLLDPIFPRSVRYCLEGLSKSMRVIRGNPVPGPPDDLECLTGRMLATWSYVRIDELISQGLHEAIDRFQGDLNRLHALIDANYFVVASPQAEPDDSATAADTSTVVSASSACAPA